MLRQIIRDHTDDVSVPASFENINPAERCRTTYPDPGVEEPHQSNNSLDSLGRVLGFGQTNGVLNPEP